MAVQIKDNACFSYAESGAAVLQDVNIAVPRGSLLGIVGPSGAGKSTLLKAMCGELYAVQGNIAVFM